MTDKLTAAQLRDLAAMFDEASKNTIEAAHGAVSIMRAILRDEAARREAEGQSECAHETTVRGGAIWTICKDCGAKWADDEKPDAPPPPADDLLGQLYWS